MLGAALSRVVLEDPDQLSELRAARMEAAGSLLSRLESDELGADVPEVLSNSNSTADRSMLILVAARADADTLRSLIRDTAAMSHGASRRFSLEVLLSRYAEIDPYDAIDLLRELRLDGSFLGTIYSTWADNDPASALRSLQTITDADDARTIAMALLEALGGDDIAAEKIEASLPPDFDPVRFRLDVLASEAETSPHTAFDEAMAIEDDATRARALMRIAPVFAKVDPSAALAAGELINDWDQKWRFQSQVMRDWAREDPAAVMQYIRGLDSSARTDTRFTTYAYDILADHDPAGFLEFAVELPARQRLHAQNLAMAAWGRNDSAAALQALEQLPTGQHRQLIGAFARGYGQSDPDGAILWAKSLDSRNSDVVIEVISSLSKTDPERAVQLAAEIDNDQERGEVLAHISMRTAYSANDPGRVANAMLQLPDSDAKDRALANLTQSWGNMDPESALQWLINQGEGIHPERYGELGRTLAYSDPVSAAAMTGSIPAAARGAWIANVASGYAEVDPVGSLNWVRQFQGQPEYEGALVAAAHAAAEHDPQAVLALVGAVQDTNNAAAITGAAVGAWSLSNPSAAASWAQSQTIEQVRSAAITGVARQWATQDAAAAGRWVMKLESGPLRDDALAAVVASQSRNANPDPSLFDAFTSDTARQQAVLRAIYSVARRDRDAARVLLDDYVKDPALRRQGEQVLSRTGH